MTHLLHLMIQYECIIINQSLQFFHISLIVHLMFFFYSKILSKANSTFSCRISWSSSLLWWFLGLTWVLMTLTDLGSTSRVFCRIPDRWDLSDAFLTTRLRLWFFGKEITEVKCHFYHISQLHMLSIWLTIVDVDLDHMANVVFVRFLQCRITFSVLAIMSSLEGSHHAEPTAESESYASLLGGLSIGISYLKFWTRGLSINSHLFIQSFIYNSMDSWLFILHFGLQSNIYFIAKLFWLRPLGVLLVGGFFPPCTPLLSGTTRWSRLILYISCHRPKIYHSPKSPGSFSWRMVSETKIWVLGMLIVISFWLQRFDVFVPHESTLAFQLGHTPEILI